MLSLVLDLVLPEPSDDEQEDMEEDGDLQYDSFQQETPESEQDNTLSDGKETPILKRTGHLFAPMFYPKVFQGIVSTLSTTSSSAFLFPTIVSVTPQSV